MLSSTVLTDTNIVTARYDGALNADEMRNVRRQIDAVIAEHGSAKLLVEYGDVDFSRMEPRAMWEDLKTGGVLNDVDRIAVVTDHRWAQKLSDLSGALMPVQVHVYDTGQRAEALSWLRS